MVPDYYVDFRVAITTPPSTDVRRRREHLVTKGKPQHRLTDDGFDGLSVPRLPVCEYPGKRSGPALRSIAGIFGAT